LWYLETKFDYGYFILVSLGPHDYTQEILSPGGQNLRNGANSKFEICLNFNLSHRDEKGKVSIMPYIFGVAMPRQAQKCKSCSSGVKYVAVVSLQSQKKYDYFFKKYPSIKI